MKRPNNNVEVTHRRVARQHKPGLRVVVPFSGWKTRAKPSKAARYRSVLSVSRRKNTRPLRTNGIARTSLPPSPPIQKYEKKGETETSPDSHAQARDRGVLNPARPGPGPEPRVAKHRHRHRRGRAAGWGLGGCGGAGLKRRERQQAALVLEQADRPVRDTGGKGLERRTKPKSRDGETGKTSECNRESACGSEEHATRRVRRGGLAGVGAGSWGMRERWKW